MYAHNLWVAAVATKHNGFKEEREIRIGWIEPINMTTGEFSQDFKKDSLKHRTSKMGITPYIEFNTAEYLKIKEITVGPKYSGALIDIKDYLALNGYETNGRKIKKSEIPYR